MIREEEIFRLLGEVVSPEQVTKAVPLSSLTTMRVGGPADIVCTPYGKEEVKSVLRALLEEHVPFIVLGKGSNVVASDIGYDGVVVRIADNMQRISVQGNILVVEAGASLASIARIAAANSLTGMEFASGIPGTLGGAIFMNAGAYGSEMKDIVQEVEVMDATGKVMHLDRSEMDFRYRHSVLQTKSWICLGATLMLDEGKEENILGKMKELNEQRRLKQPLEYPSSGSTFKRPEGYFAGALIQEAGLKGYTVGGAQVSEKHAGFVVNKGGATCRDILDLVNDVQKKVKENSGVALEAEIRYLTPGGFENFRG